MNSLRQRRCSGSCRCLKALGVHSAKWGGAKLTASAPTSSPMNLYVTEEEFQDLSFRIPYTQNTWEINSYNICHIFWTESYSLLLMLCRKRQWICSRYVTLCSLVYSRNLLAPSSWYSSALRLDIPGSLEALLCLQTSLPNYTVSYSSNLTWYRGSWKSRISQTTLSHCHV